MAADNLINDFIEWLLREAERSAERSLSHGNRVEFNEFLTNFKNVTFTYSRDGTRCVDAIALAFALGDLDIFELIYNYDRRDLFDNIADV